MLRRFVIKRTLIQCLAFLALGSGFFILGRAALAQANVNLGLGYATAIGLTTTDIRTTIALVINAFFGLLGLVMVVLMIYAGYLWMTARGEDEQITDAKKIIQNAAIGLLIVIAAYGITAFIFQAVTGEGLIGGGDDTRDNITNIITTAPPGSSALGSIIDAHFPERDQTGVPRNTMISITFKQPIVLSTILQNYNDTTPYDPTATYQLNTTNIRIIQQPNIAAAPASDPADTQFGTMYGAAITSATVRVTQISESPFNPNAYQTLVIVPSQPLGSPTTNVNYRVALRSGVNGIKVWGAPGRGRAQRETQGPVDQGCAQLEQSTQPRQPQCAFPIARTTGGYFWAFTTSTTIDTTPPKIVSVIPQTVSSPASASVARNQLLQIFFDEPIDPTTASGRIGGGGGLTNVLVQAKCPAGAQCGGVCSNDATRFCSGNSSCSSGGTCVSVGATYQSLSGTVAIGSRYQVAQYTPSTVCENGSPNSCGDTVYCMPPNVDVQVTARAATVGSNPPQSDGQFNGVTDMAGNSLDGNGNGSAQGPTGAPYNRNQPQASLSGVSDTAQWTYRVNNLIDFQSPTVVDISPKSFDSIGGGSPSADAAYPAGPSRVPKTLPITLTWDKPLDITSLRTGGFTNDTNATIAIGANECRKTGACTGTPGSGSCPCTPVEPIAFWVSYTALPANQSQVTINHRPFFQANDLGYNESDITISPRSTPDYVPKIAAQVRDATQNCFYPSKGPYCVTSETGRLTSCCNRTAQAGFPGSGSNCQP